MKFNLKTALGALLVATIMTGCSGSSDPKITAIPVKVDKDSKWGMVGSDGKVIFEDEFDEEPTEAFNGFFNVMENGGISVYAAEEKPRLLGDLETLRAAGIMSEGLIPIVRPSERITVYTDKGEKAFELEPYEGKEIVYTSSCFLDGMLPFGNEDGLVGAINTKGEVKVKPIYAKLSNFSEGYAFGVKPVDKDSVGGKDDDVPPVYIINKKGEELVKVEGLTFHTLMTSGRFAASKADRWGFVDKKGEFTKMPAKVKGILLFNDKYFVYKNDDGKVGVMDMEGETVIRAKYEQVAILENGKFLCVTDDGKKAYIVNDKDEREKTFDDIDGIAPIADFALITRMDKEFTIMNWDGEPMNKEGFYSLSVQTPHKYLFSEYFNPEAAAQKLVSYITDQGCGTAKLGELISNFASGDPKKYVGDTEYTIPDIKGGYLYTIMADAHSNNKIALSEPVYVEKTNNSYWGAYTYRSFDHYEYSWNPEAICDGIDLSLKPRLDGLYTTLKANVIKSLEAKGYRADETNDAYAILSKGDIIMMIMPESSFDSSWLRLFMCNSHEFETIRDNLIRFAQRDYDKIASKQVKKSAD